MSLRPALVSFARLLHRSGVCTPQAGLTDTSLAVAGPRVLAACCRCLAHSSTRRSPALTRAFSSSGRRLQQEDARASTAEPTDDSPKTSREAAATAAEAAAEAAAGKALCSAPLPQLEVPDYGRELLFKGLETDFPCLSRLPPAGPEPEYHKVSSGFKLFQSTEPFHLKYNNCVLPELHLAYETWGQLNHDRSNAVILNTGMSASSHAKSHQDNPTPGWWEKFVGPGCAIDTDKFFVICTNVLGGCYGSSGPSSLSPVTGKAYGTNFPLVTVEDIVRAIFLILDQLKIDKAYACVGSSLGGMTSLMAPALFPDRVGRAICISSCAQTHPSTIGMRYLQRRAVMTDPNWARGHYYGQSFPRMGMKLAREIATITYRSGAEWLHRFGRATIGEESPSLCPYFEIEGYIEHQGEQFSVKYDPNSLLYLSKAMDFFDMGEGFPSLAEGLARVQCPIMIMGAKTDILIPITQQRELARLLKESGNDRVTYYELDSIYGHDTFLLDLNNVGAAIKGQLETDLKERGMVRKSKPKWLAGDNRE